MKPKKAKRYRKPTEGAIHARLTPAMAEELRVWLARNAPRHPYMGQKMGIEGFLIQLVVAAIRQLDPREVDRILDAARPVAEQYEHEWNREQARKEVDVEKMPPAPESTGGRGIPQAKPGNNRKRA